jgi:hypothetical protein
VGAVVGVGVAVGAAATVSSTVRVAPPVVVIRSRKVPVASSAYSLGSLIRPSASVVRAARVRTGLPSASLK